MKRRLHHTVLLLAALAPALLAAAPDTEQPARQTAAPPEAYRIQPGDLLEVSVWKEEGLAREALVRPDGALSFPLIGEVRAGGRTVEQLRADLAARLEQYIPDPVVTVSVQQALGHKVYVIGKVARPGEFPASRPIDVMQALSKAGGTTPYAALNKIRILRRVDGEPAAIPFRYGDVEKGENLEQNIILQSGDVVVVP